MFETQSGNQGGLESINQDAYRARIAAQMPSKSMEAYNNGAHLEGRVETFRSEDEAISFLNSRSDNFNDLAYVSSEPLEGQLYNLRRNGDIYILVDASDDRMAYAATKNSQLLDKYLKSQAA